MTDDILGISIVGKANRVTLKKEVMKFLDVSEGSFIRFRMNDKSVVIEAVT